MQPTNYYKVLLNSYYHERISIYHTELLIQATELLISHNDWNSSNNTKIYTIIYFSRFSPIIDNMRGKVARWQCCDATVRDTNQYHLWHHGNKLYHHLSNVRWEQIVRMLTDMLILLIHFLSNLWLFVFP